MILICWDKPDIRPENPAFMSGNRPDTGRGKPVIRLSKKADIRPICSWDLINRGQFFPVVYFQNKIGVCEKCKDVLFAKNKFTWVKKIAG